jgi:hypothetical protein
LKRWLVAYFTSNDTVHPLRNATGQWLERHVVPLLREEPDVQAVLTRASTARDGARPSTEHPPELDELLGGPTDDEPPEGADLVDPLFETVVAARFERENETIFPPGTEPEERYRVVETVGGTVKRVLKQLKSEAERAESHERPRALLNKALALVREAQDALVEVEHLDAFERVRSRTIRTADGVSVELDKLQAALGAKGSSDVA